MPYSGFDISGKVVFVTGGTSGIGKAIALGCAQAGAKVIAGSTNPEKVAAIQLELEKIGPGHEATAINVADEASVKKAMEFAVSRGGRLDAVIHAAGVIKRQPSLQMPVEEFRRIVDVNLTGTFIVNQAAARIMKEQSAGARGQARQHRQRCEHQQLHQPDRSACLRRQQVRGDRDHPRIGE